MKKCSLCFSSGSLPSSSNPQHLQFLTSGAGCDAQTWMTFSSFETETHSLWMSCVIQKHDRGKMEGSITRWLHAFLSIQYLGSWTGGGGAQVLEKTQADVWRRWQLHTERPRPNRGSNQKPFLLWGDSAHCTNVPPCHIHHASYADKCVCWCVFTAN